MITKTLKTTYGKVKIQIPENLNEITVGQMVEWEKIQDDSKNNSIPFIPGLTREVADNLSYDDLESVRDRILSIAHQIKYCYKGDVLPKTVTFGTKRVKILGLFYIERDNIIPVIENLSVEPAGAYVVCRDLIADEINKHIEQYGEEDWKENFVPSLDACAGLLANYFYCRVTKLPYNEQKADEFKSEVLKLPIQTALPIARHFFLRYPDLSKQKIKLWDRLRLNWKEKLALRRLKSSGTSTR